MTVTNPGSWAEMSYVPAGMLAIVYRPAVSVVVARCSPVSVFVAVTVTPGTAARLSSVTRPRIATSADCADARPLPVITHIPTMPSSRTEARNVIRPPRCGDVSYRGESSRDKAAAQHIEGEIGVGINMRHPCRDPRSPGRLPPIPLNAPSYCWNCLPVIPTG